jgi:ribonuclease R
MQTKTHTRKLEREDIRHLDVFTIDPDTAKDFDDALSLVSVLKDGKKEAGWYELGVHIADVSHFVPFNSPVDMRAQEKATSIYLVEECLPMLPPHLSEDACSLVPNEDRNTFSVFFEINEQGHIRKTRFAKTLIHSKKRFTYTTAQHVIDTKKGTLSHELLLLAKITTRIRADRIKHGGIEFNNEEIQFTFKEVQTADGVKKQVVGLKKKELLFTMQMIEECMLLANVAVAQALKKAVNEHKIPLGVYRVHNGPQGEKLSFLSSMLASLQIPFKLAAGKVTSIELKNVLKVAKQRDLLDCVQMVMLRSMGKAEYVTKNVGHFGLGFPAYTHFTSPIRRYADVMVHRLLYAYLTGSKITAAESQAYTKLVTHATTMEINAQEQERDSIKYHQTQYLANHLGKKCAGHITGVMPFGIFVRDSETMAEGFIHVRSLPDYLTHHEATRTLRGKKSNYKLGDPIKFKIVKVDTERNRIDCEMM